MMQRFLSSVLVCWSFCSAGWCQTEFQSDWPTTLQRTWIGPAYWANRLQDWRIVNGRLECLNGKMQQRTVHLLTHRVTRQTGTVQMAVRLGLVDPQLPPGPDSAAGFLIGAGDPDLDVRAAALVQMAPGPDGGWFAGLTGDGHLLLRENSRPKQPRSAISEKAIALQDAVLSLEVQTTEESTRLTLKATAPDTEQLLATVTCDGIEPRSVRGNLALVSHPGKAAGTRYWFRDWRGAGSQLEMDRSQLAGPILCSQYTLSNNVLKITAQLMPIGVQDNQSVLLETQEGEDWVERARAGRLPRLYGHDARDAVGFESRCAVPTSIRSETGPREANTSILAGHDSTRSRGSDDDCRGRLHGQPQLPPRVWQEWLPLERKRPLVPPYGLGAPRSAT